METVVINEIGYQAEKLHPLRAMSGLESISEL